MDEVFDFDRSGSTAAYDLNVIGRHDPAAPGVRYDVSIIIETSTSTIDFRQVLRREFEHVAYAVVLPNPNSSTYHRCRNIMQTCRTISDGRKGERRGRETPRFKQLGTWCVLSAQLAASFPESISNFLSAPDMCDGNLQGYYIHPPNLRCSMRLRQPRPLVCWRLHNIAEAFM